MRSKVITHMKKIPLSAARSTARSYAHIIIRHVAMFLTAAMLMFTACEPIGVPEETHTAVVTAATEETPEPVVIYGVSFVTAPERVVCLSPAITEILYEIGMDGKIVGVGQYCDYPPAAMEEKDVCGSAANPDFETIIGLSPDLLITQSPIANKDLTRLKNAGITVLNIPAVVDINELETLYNSLEELSFGVTEQSDREPRQADIPGLASLNTAIADSNINLGSFIYYLSDDLTAAGDDTFSGNFFGSFGTNLCGEFSMVMPLETDTSDNDTSDNDGETSDTDVPDTDSGTSDTDIPDTVILPAYLAYFKDDYLAETASRVIILTEQATSLLERPTDRVRFVLGELSADIAETTIPPDVTEQQ
jgi:iron complex transport system substrate-binding protein